MKRSREGKVKYRYALKRTDGGNDEEDVKRLGLITTTQPPIPGLFSTTPGRFSTSSGVEKDFIRKRVYPVNVTSPLSTPGQIVSRGPNPISFTSSAFTPSPLPYISSPGRESTRSPGPTSLSSLIPNSKQIVPFVSELVRIPDPYNLTSQPPIVSLGNSSTRDNSDSFEELRYSASGHKRQKYECGNYYERFHDWGGLPQLPIPVCKLDGCSKPAYVEGTRVHDYCGMTHYLLGTGQSEGGDVPVELRCNTPGCKRQKYKTDGRYFDYCSKSCRDRGSLSELSLPAPPVIKDICRIARATRDEYQKLSQQFISDWVKGNPPPLVSISVYMITNTALEREWQAYKDKLSDTTIERHYHGTKLCCDISSLKLCSNESCGICGITWSSFDQDLIGTNISRFKRFGDAFYLAPHSSKCHDYTVGYGQHRAMLYFQTLPGRKLILKKTDVEFVLPSGYDSAYGVPGQSLNYPELMLYKSEAALPLCIFTYRKDGIEQIAK